MYGYPKNKLVHECAVCDEWHDEWTINKKADEQGSMLCHKCQTVYWEKVKGVDKGNEM